MDRKPELPDFYIPPFEPFSLDISFCANEDCPFKKCRRHIEDLRRNRPYKIIVSVSDFGGTCRTYHEFLGNVLGSEAKRKK